MGDLIKLETIVQIICPECESPYWLAFKDLGHECAECGYKDWENTQV